MRKFFGEFTGKDIGEILDWREYVTNLDLSHWRWVDSLPWEDREVLELEEHQLVFPIYPRDILKDPLVSYVELPNKLLAISWDDFRNDVAVVRNNDTGEPVGWLLLEKDETGFKVRDGCPSPFETLIEIREFLEDEQQDNLLRHR